MNEAKGMFTAKMIAPCGLDCRLCARALDSEAPCPGCNGPDANKPSFCSDRCGIVLCGKRKENGYTFCDECPEYPCRDVMEKERRYTCAYPLVESPLKNLRLIREKGMERFLEREKARWTCGECGGVICVHTGVCSACGKKYGVQVIRMGTDTWRIEDGGVRFFLLAGKEKALMIDSGMNVPQAREIAQTLTDLPVELLNTHADRDHIGCNDEFESFYMHPADEDQYRRSGKGGRLIPLRDGGEMDLGDRRLKIIHLPGHTPGSVAVLDVRDRVLISGDPIQEHGRIFMFGEHRNMRDFIDSLKRLETMSVEFDMIWPSHADLPLSPDAVGRVRAGAERILSGEAEGRQVEFFGRSIVLYDMGTTAFLCES